MLRRLSFPCPFQCLASALAPFQGGAAGSGQLNPSRGVARPLSAQSPPRGRKRAASKGADFTAFWTDRPLWLTLDDAATQQPMSTRVMEPVTARDGACNRT